MPRSTIVSLLLIIYFSCGGHSDFHSPSGPTPIPVPSLAVRLHLGQTLNALVSVNDPSCDPLVTVPCRCFLIDIPRSGRLTVRVEWPGSGAALVLRGVGEDAYSTSSFTKFATVSPGLVQISVGLHVAASSTQAFQLTASLDP